MVPHKCMHVQDYSICMHMLTCTDPTTCMTRQEDTRLAQLSGPMLASFVQAVVATALRVCALVLFIRELIVLMYGWCQHVHSACADKSLLTF